MKIFNSFFQFFFINMYLRMTPVWYIYLKLLISVKNEVKVKIIRHFITYIISILYLSYLAIFLPIVDFDSLIYLPIKEQTILLKIISLSKLSIIPFYLLLAIRLLKRHVKNISTVFSYSEGITLKWIKIFIIIIFIGWLFAYIPYFIGLESNMDITMTLNGFMLLYFGYFGIKQSTIFSIKDKVEVSPPQ